jgi:hypothetical protein
VRRIQPGLWRNGWIYHQDNAPSQNDLFVKQFLACKNMAVLAHPLPYSPDRAPCDFFLFSKIETVFKGTHFMPLEEVKAKRTEPVNSLINALNSGSIV